MTSATYTALADCARRRIEQEWTCTAAERAVLQLIADLSFGLGQTWAYVPCLADFAAVLGVHKSTVCRALRGARKKGYLEILQRRDETLYTLCTQTRGEAADGAQDEAAAVRRRLVELNQARLQGQADPDGQARLPGVLPSEETGAPAAAFSAMMEETARPWPTEGSQRRKVEASAGATDEEEPLAEFHARLENLVRTAERRRGEVESGAAPPPEPPPQRSQAAIFDEAMEKLCRGLKGEPLFVLQQVRAEVQTRGNLQEAAFFKYGGAWRKRVMEHTAAVREAVGEHKNLRLTQGQGADEPGAWIFRRMQSFAQTG